MILRKQERNNLFYGATKFYARPREWANIGCTAIIITCFISRAYGFLAATHRRVYTIVTRMVSSHVCRLVCNFDRRVHFYARICARRWRRWRASVCICQAQEQKRTVNRFYERGREPIRPLCRASYEPPVNPRERVIYRKCNRRDWSREVRTDELN